MRLPVVLLCLAVMSCLTSSAQFSLPSTDPQIINFDETREGVNENIFSGAGLSATPDSGRLDTDAWAITGLSDGEVNFGSNPVDGDFARGTSSGGTTTGGIYAFEVAPGNHTLGWQATASDLTPGALFLRLQNDLPDNESIFELTISYTLYTYNDAGRSTIVSFSHSSNNISYTLESSVDYSTLEAAEDPVAWSDTTITLTLTGLNIPNGAFYYLAWATADGNGNGARDELALDNISVTVDATGPATPRFFRTAQSGDWSNPSTWEASFDGLSYNPASLVPDWVNSDSVCLQAGHVIDLDLDLTIDQLIVKEGAILVMPNQKLLINDGAPGADFLLNGTLQDSATSGEGIAFRAGAGWAMGPSATLVKTRNSSAANYRDFYQGGMENIPATANWIVRYTGVGDPSFTTTNTTYPNLTLESSAGPWAPNVFTSIFSGTSGTALIKGNLNVGGSGSGTVSIINENSDAAPIAILGDLIIGAGSTLQTDAGGDATGWSVGGDVQVAGSLIFSGNSILEFVGASDQTLSVPDGNTIDRLVVNKTGGAVQVLAPLIITERLALNSGNLQLSGADLTLAAGAELVGGGPDGYIETGEMGALVQEVGGSPVVFPVGNNAFQPAVLTNAGATDQFSVQVRPTVRTQGTVGNPITDVAVDLTWFVEETTPGGSDVTLELHWMAGDELAGFDRGACFISHFSGGEWQAGPTGSADGNGPFSRTRSGITSFSPFAVGSPGSLLPVEWAYVEARPSPQGVQLHWGTLNEWNNDYFVITKSTDGMYFFEIGRRTGAGNSTRPLNYTWLDPDPAPGDHYYRIEQVDFDGKVHYSPVVVQTVAGPSNLGPLIRGVGQPQVINTGDAPLQVSVFDQSGRRLGQTLVAGGAYTQPLASLPAGVYLLHWRRGQRTGVQQVVKTE